MNIMPNQKGFSLGKATAGAILLGPLGLIGGLHGSKSIELVCQSCGQKWKPAPSELK